MNYKDTTSATANKPDKRMPGSKLFYDYIQACFQRLLQSMEKYHASKSVKALFRFRVSIKKIRTTLKCLEFYNGVKPYKSMRNDLKKLFRSGGTLREMYLYKAWMERNGLRTLINDYDLDKKIEEWEKKYLHKKDESKRLLEKMKQEVLSDALKITQDQVFGFYVDLVRNRLIYMTGVVKEVKWHKTRKEFKRILYARHWQDEEGLKLISQRQATFLDQFQHLIGYWHDNEDMINWLTEEQGETKASSNTLAFKKALTLLKERERRYRDRVKSKNRQCPAVMNPLRIRLKKLEANV